MTRETINRSAGHNSDLDAFAVEYFSIHDSDLLLSIAETPQRLRPPVRDSKTNRDFHSSPRVSDR